MQKNLPRFDIEVLDERHLIVNGDKLQGKRGYLSERFIFFYLGDWVIKLDSIEGNRGQCNKEILFWNKVKDTEYDKYFAPILYSKQIGKYRALIVEPAYKIVYYRNNYVSDKLDRIVRKFGLNDVCRDYVYNWTIHLGEPIIYDYAF